MIPPRFRPPILLLAATAASGCLAHTPAITGPDGRPLPGSVASLEKLEVGGAEQWVLIRGADATNPVLLRLHGGPGAAEMPLVPRYNGDLEEHFVVVAWDQRGAGKSNRRGFDEGSMTFERFLQDAHELTRLLKERFGQERIYLMGHSWGTQLGIRLAARYPEDYWAYIGVSQLVDQERGTEVAHAWLSDRLRKEGRPRELARLEALGPPPYPDHGDYVRFIQMVDARGGGMDVGFGRLAWAAVRAPEYTFLDLNRWLGGANRGSGPMWETPDYRDHDAFRAVPRLEVPVYFFAGRDDYNTPLALVREYADFLEAPAGKEVVVFEASAHTPFLAEPGRFADEMVRVKEETLVAQRRSPELQEGRGHDEAAAIPTERVILPFLFYSPETKLGGGAVAAGYRRLAPNLPSSSLLGAATFTARRQLSLEAGAAIHRRGGGRVDASAGFSHFPDQFFGVGPDTPDEAEEAYTSRMLDMKLRIQRQVRPGLRMGPQVTFRWEDVVEVEEGGLLASSSLTASEGGQWLGLGAVATLDHRDHVLQPRQGVYVEASFLGFPEGLGTTGYRQALLDVRRFLPLGTASTVAFRTSLTGAGGEVPVLLLPALGGRERLRGYYEGRVRDRVAASAQGEVRFPVWRRLGAVAFGEVGQVAPRLGDLASRRPEVSAGAGLRFRLGEEAARIRVDLAVGRKGSGLYLTIGEAF
jgi:pimeloyl-ACP methyl ester carboxylesterase